MFKKIVISCFLSTMIFADNSKILDENTNINTIHDERFSKIFVSGNKIVVEDKVLMDSLVKFIKDKFLFDNPTISMQVEENFETDINLDSCAGCHGYEFDKSALNKSKIISKMSREEIEEALLGYKDGTYGGSMKSLKKAQTMKYTDEELKGIAKMISDLSNQNKAKSNNVEIEDSKDKVETKDVPTNVNINEELKKMNSSTENK